MKTKLLACSLALVLIPTICLGQRGRGTLTGTVTDSTGAVAPNVQLTITKTDTGAVYKSATTEAGAYSVPNLPSGPYKIDFEAAGFKKLERGNIQLSENQVIRVDVTLEIGAITESVQVTAELSRVETDTPRVAIDMRNQDVRNMPISITALTVEDWVFRVTPGVFGNSYDAVVNGVNVHNTKLSLIDGLPAGTSEQNTITESSPSIESIGEFNVQTAGYSAEYGRASNGVFTYVMRSGTNDWHGGALGGIRNEALSANTFTNNFQGLPRNKDREQRYAFSLGGPVIIPKIYNGKNKTFFYASYERYRQHTRSNPAPNANYPIPDFYNGDFSRLLTTTIRGTDAMGRNVMQGAIYDPNTVQQLPSGRYIADAFSGNQIPVSRFSTISKNINKIGLERYQPTYKDPKTGLFPLTQNAWNGAPGAFDQYNFAIKGDQNISDRHKLSGAFERISRPTVGNRGAFFDQNDPKSGGPFANLFQQDYVQKRSRIMEDWTISPHIFNHFGITFNRGVNKVQDGNAGVDGAAVYGIKGLKLNDFPGINWGGGPIWPLANPVPFNLQGMQSVWYMTYTTWAFQDSISFSTGRHFMKAGYENWNWFYNGPVGPPYAAFNFSSASTTIPQEQTIGNYTGYSFASYLLGMVNSASLAAPNPLSPHGLYHALYFQDDFKFRPNLTLNLGVRYDYNPLAFESHDRITSWNPYKTDPLVNLPGAYDFAGSCAICTGRRNFGTRDFNNFGPRIGFAWQALKDFTIRGAYTISFIGDDSGTALGSTPGFTTGGMGPDIVGAGSYDLAANALYPWKGLFNWDDGFPQDRYVPPTRNLSYADTLGPAYYVDPRYGIAPYIQQWNLNLQKQLPGKVLLDIGYIGNKGNKLRHPALERINQTPASAISQYGANLPRTITSAADAARYGVPYPYPGFTGTVNSALRQFPQLRSNSTVNTIAGDDGFSNYHSLNLIVNRQFHQGLSIYANWVWSKTIDNMGGAMLDYYNRDLDSLINASDAPHRVKIFVQYQLPLGRNKYFGTGMPRVLDWIVGGWEVSGIGNYSSGNPLGFSGAPAINGWNGGTPRMMVQPGEPGLPLVRGDYDYANRLSKPAANKYFDTSLVSSPAPLTLGSAAPRFAYFRSWGTRSEDLGLRKVFRVKEKYITQVRADFLNAINRHNLPGPNTGITSPYFGYITGNPGGNRVIEGSVKFDF